MSVPLKDYPFYVRIPKFFYRCCVRVKRRLILQPVQDRDVEKAIEGFKDLMSPQIKRGFQAGSALSGKENRARKLNFIITHPSPRWSGSGHYLHEIASCIVAQGHKCFVLAEGAAPLEEGGVQYAQINFEGPLLQYAIKKRVIDFKPDYVIQVGVRTKPMRTALEIIVATHAKLIVQSEDDEKADYKSFHRHFARFKLLSLLDKPCASEDDYVSFLKSMNWRHFIRVFMYPGYDRRVEPLLRIICYRMACIHTNIWHPMGERFQASFNKPNFVLTHVIRVCDYNPLPEPALRKELIAEYGLKEESLILFTGGTIYDYSKEMNTFFKMLRMASAHFDNNIVLMVTGRSRLNFNKKLMSLLGPHVRVISLNIPSDREYLRVMKGCDVVVTPGYEDDFNKYRLASRLVKAMALGKAIYTFRWGFGESLIDGKHAILTEGHRTKNWLKQFLRLRNSDLRDELGIHARKFAEENFDAVDVTNRFLEFIYQSQEDCGRSSVEPSCSKQSL